MTYEIFFNIAAPAYARELGSDYDIRHDDGSPLAENVANRIRVAVTSGFAGFSREEMMRFPSLGLICTVGTGYENVDLEAAFERRILVSHAAGTNAPSVADHAMAMLLALVRHIPVHDKVMKANRWRADIGPRPMISGKTLGIIGMGAIGQLVARRAAGFDMEICYMATAPKPFLPYNFMASGIELAKESDFVICTAPGGSATFHMVNGQVLSALGPSGYLVNVGRGSVVDTAALIAALQSGAIAGAALDVFENEPGVPAELRELDNIILTPHMAGVAPEVQQLSARLMHRNIEAFLAGEPLVSPVPEMATVDWL